MAEASTVGQLVRGIRDRLGTLEAEREHLVALLAMYEGGQQDLFVGERPPDKLPAPRVPVSLADRFKQSEGGPTALILRTLAEAPHGLRSSEIADRIEGQMTTSAENPRRSIYSVLSTLKRRGKVRTQKGVYTLGQ